MNTSFKTTTYNQICLGVQTNDKKLIERGQKALSVYGQVGGDIGFTYKEISDKYDYLSEKLESLNRNLNSASLKLSKVNKIFYRSNGAGVSKKDINERKQLSSMVVDIGDSIRIVKRIQFILGDEIERRNNHINAMAEERHNSTLVTA